MACIRKRRGKYVVDYRDSAGVRRWVTCETRDQADGVLADKIRESSQAAPPVHDRKITVKEYGAHAGSSSSPARCGRGRWPAIATSSRATSSPGSACSGC
jgi:hypothetical protein